MARVSRETKALYEMCAIALVKGNATLDGAEEVGFQLDMPIFTVTHVASLTETHPQTLRQYDRLTLVTPQRTEGGARRYSLRDIDRLIQTQQLSQQEGINLAGIMRILELQEENRQLKRQLRLMSMHAQGTNIFTANSEGDIVEMQRSNNARRWRRDIRTERRALPGSYTRDTFEESSVIAAKSVVLWRQ